MTKWIPDAVIAFSLLAIPVILAWMTMTAIAEQQKIRERLNNPIVLGPQRTIVITIP